MRVRRRTCCVFPFSKGTPSFRNELTTQLIRFDSRYAQGKGGVQWEGVQGG